LVERELRRREQRDALREAAGSWKDEEHPELAEGADKWVREMRQEAVKRFEKIELGHCCV
jgi:predicted Holliday junction resolvase-like endonuclease